MLSPRRYALILVLALLVIGCGEGRQGNRPLAPEVETPVATDTVRFASAGLDSAVRLALGQPPGVLASTQVQLLTQLNATGRGIADLIGIGALANLQVLELADNQITDLSPLRSLIHLHALNLENNRISDLTSLAGLDSLQILLLDFNQVTDATPLLRLPALQFLSMLGNPLEPTLRSTVTTALMARGARVDTTATETPLPFMGECLALTTTDGALYLAAPDSGEPRLLLRPEEGSRIEEPAWSPDGTRLAVSIVDGSGEGDLYVIDGIANQVTRLTSAPGWEMSPTWSPDGQFLAFAAPRDNNTEIFTIPVEGGAWYRLTDNQTTDLEPAWSPDGLWIAYSSRWHGLPTLFIMQPDGSGVQQLVPDNKGLSARKPVWSPGGGLIGFLNEETSVCVIRADGTGGIRLTNTNGIKTALCWTPGGSLAFIEGYKPYLLSVTANPSLQQPERPVRALSLWCSGLAWSPAAVYGFDREVELPEVPLSFADRNLEQAIREALGTEGPVYKRAASRLKDLPARSRGIVDLSGLEYLRQLEKLDLNNEVTWLAVEGGDEEPDTTGQSNVLNRVADLTPLAGLVTLTELGLAFNPVADLSPLKGLGGLSRLRIDGSPLSDLSALGNNRRLTSLVLRHLPVSDLSALNRLALLQEVRINWTLAADVTPLSKQRHLARLDLAHNRIADISPLANTVATEIWLTGNPLNEESLKVHVRVLRARGVTVHLE